MTITTPSTNEPATAPETRTGGQALAGQLEREGVDVIFGLPGDQMMHSIDALYDVRDEIRFITTRHEQATTYMADGYARATGRVGVAYVVPGVGVYNAGSGLATAYACSSPVFMVAGQVNRHGIGKTLGLLHEVHDQLELVKPITKWSTRVLEPEGIAVAVNTAVGQALSGRPRPTYVEIPPEGFSDTGDVSFYDPIVVEPQGADPQRVAEAAAILAGAQRPLIVAGGGVVSADASEQLRAIAEYLQAPVVMTREGKGAISDRHGLALGVMWTNPRVAPHIHDADVILAVGTRFTGIGAASPTRVVQIDVDVAELGKQYGDTYGVAGHARPTLQQLVNELQRITKAAASRVAEVQAKRAVIIERLHAIGPAAKLVEDLRAAIPDDGIVVSGTTTVGYMSHMRFDVYEPRTYLGSSYMGTLGFAFPTSLGAKIGQPHRPVVSINGDGGFLFCSNELATAVQYDIPVVACVFNDGAYGNSNRDQRDRFKGREYTTELRNPDFAKLAEAFGADGMKVAHMDQAGDALREAVANNRPTVLEVPIPRLPSPFVP
jgi:acetolactate synthase-1/2/3 large subunit